MASVKGRSGRRNLFGQQITRQVAERIGGKGITPLEVLVSAMRITWERSKAEDHRGPDLLLALSCAERAAPYMHARVGPIDEKSRILAESKIRVVVQRLTQPRLLANGEPQMVSEVDEAVIVEEDPTRPRDRYQEPASGQANGQDGPTIEGEAYEEETVDVDLGVLRAKLQERRERQRAKRKRAAKPKAAA